MDNKSKVSLIFDIIKRYDSYIISTNAKASLVIAFNSLILGSILFKSNDIISLYCSSGAKIFIGIIIICISISSLLSLGFVFKVVYPFLGEKIPDTSQHNSIVYFGSVSKLNSTEYYERFELCNDDTLLKDLTEQANILSKGLDSKMLKLRYSIRSIMAGLVCIFILLIIHILKTL